MSSFPALALLALLAVPSPISARASAQPIAAPAPAVPASQPTSASLDQYRAHLQALTTVVQLCAKARDTKNCDPTLVGPDDQIPTSQSPNAEHRLVRYGWLRVLLSKAQETDAPTPKPKSSNSQDAPQSPLHPTLDSVRPAPLTTTQLLKDAQTRLAADLAQANAPPASPANHDQVRATMKQVLSGSEYANLETTTPKDSALEKVGNWLNDVLESAMRASARAPWLGRVLVWGFILGLCVALVWGLLQLERRWRVRLVPDDRPPALGAASAIPWQVWMEDARRAAAAGLWREAIHFLYWASISRLESKRLWPADRARTPREYLALVAPEDPRKPGLATLTGSFETVWYGGRAAGESDYQRAEQIASALISGSSGSGGTQ